MSTNETAILDPFDVGAPDEAAELLALVRALELAQRFRLLFVRCNQIPQRERLMKEVGARLPKLNIQTIFFREPIVHLLDAIQPQLATPIPDVLFVSGLEFSLPVAAEAHVAPLIANLNASRNSFAQMLPFPVVLWVPEYVLTAIVQGAPDFFSIWSGVYFFAANSTELADFVQGVSIGSFWESESLSQREKQDRLAAIERLLEDYQFLPDHQRDLRAELRLVGQLGDLYFVQGAYDKALTYYQRALKLSEDSGDVVGMANALHHIGMVQQDRGDYEAALDYYQRSLKLNENLGDTASIASTLHNIGMVQHARGHYEMALDHYQRALKIDEDLGNVAGVASTLNQLGRVQRESKNYEAALAYYQHALKLNEDLGNVAGVAYSLQQMGVVQYTLGNYEAALDYYQRALKLNEGLGNVAGVASTLHNIGIVQQDRRDYGAALDYYQRALRLNEDLGLVTGVALTHEQIGRLLTETGKYDEAFGELLQALRLFLQLKSPRVAGAANDLRILRSKWSGFDAAWIEATSEDVPEWLLQAEEIST